MPYKNNNGQSDDLEVVGQGCIDIDLDREPRHSFAFFSDMQVFVPCNPCPPDELNWKIHAEWDNFQYRWKLNLSWNVCMPRKITWEIDF